MPGFIHLNSDDNIVVTTRTVSANEKMQVGNAEITCSQDVKIGHKIATEAIAIGTPVRKFGQVIGYASSEIKVGDWVHSHNLQNGNIVLQHEKACVIPDVLRNEAALSFKGYRRANDKIGTRNYIAVISTVNCSATVSKFVARHFSAERLAAYPNVDGVIALTHETGCGMKHQGTKHQMLNRVMGGFAKHANVGAYLIIGLGCEQATPGTLMIDQNLVQIGGQNQNETPVFSMQDLGGTKKND